MHSSNAKVPPRLHPPLHVSMRRFPWERLIKIQLRPRSLPGGNRFMGTDRA
ncbi:MAG: hypothetical protein BWX48_01656 [Verrucomicrobia bacterium ADurb.Bin006]|nr:MAG: hypothetical protein BWX48_01656 [Verrucomicrobia bacterium ADurb.Bin006]